MYRRPFVSVNLFHARHVRELGKRTIDRLSVARNNLEILHPGPPKHDHLFVAQRKPKTVPQVNNGSVPLPGGSNSRWLPPRRVKRGYPRYPYAALSTARPQIAAPSIPPVTLFLIPGHALHEKGLQRQKGAGPLVNSQERRARFVPRIQPRIQRGSNAGPTRVQRGLCSSTGLHTPNPPIKSFAD